MGMENLRKKGVRLLILSGEQNRVVRARAGKLKMEVQHHIVNKLPALDEWRRTNGLDWQTIAYIGNDIHDVECMKACGLRSEEHTSELQSLMRTSYAVFCMTKQTTTKSQTTQ